MKIFYKTRATAVGGRTGHTELDDGSLSFDLVAPASGKSGVNPEQLFALGYSACFDSALNHVAQLKNIPLKGSKTSVQVGMGQLPDGRFKLDVDIDVEVSGLNQEDAEALVDQAHQVCPYSNATRNNIDVRLHVKLGE